MKFKTKVFVLFVVLFLIILGYYLSNKAVISSEKGEFEEKLNNWIDSGQAKVLVDNEEIPIGSVEPVDDFTHVIIKDRDGNIIAIVLIDELLAAIEENKPLSVPSETEQNGATPPPPAPTPVEVPIPMPLPIINQTNTTPITNLTPTPTPTPTPPNVTPTPSPPLPMCINLLWDGDESDFNCGGSCAPCAPSGQYCDDTGALGPQSPYNVPCSQHLGCWANSDCASGNCDMSAALPLPAVDPVTGVIYNDYNSLRVLAGQTWIIPYSGTCK